MYNWTARRATVMMVKAALAGMDRQQQSRFVYVYLYIVIALAHIQSRQHVPAVRTEYVSPAYVSEWNRRGSHRQQQ